MILIVKIALTVLALMAAGLVVLTYVTLIKEAPRMATAARLPVRARRTNAKRLLQVLWPYKIERHKYTSKIALISVSRAVNDSSRLLRDQANAIRGKINDLPKVSDLDNLG